MEVYKVGFNLSNSSTSKNGGGHEFNLIKNAVKNIDCDKYVIIVNGIGDQTNLLKLNKKKIFVATDSFCFKENKELIDNCDVLLHQSKLKFGLNNIKKNNFFSGVPFLFYTENKKVTNQNNSIIFGGANTGRNDKFQKFLFDGDKVRPGIVAFVKMYALNGSVVYDDRINYDSFVKVLSHYKYSLMMSRSDYDELLWVTPRYIEAISNYVFPFVEVNYTLPVNCDGIYVDSYHNMMKNKFLLDDDENKRLSMIADTKMKLVELVNYFTNIVKSII